MAENILLILGVINIALIIIAIIVVVYNKKMTTAGRIIRYLEILLLPLLGPIFILMEVLSWKIKDEKEKHKK
jgi:hypothetical protein